MSYLPSNESNPFEAPKARIGELAAQIDDTDLGRAELIRRDHIGHEASIKTLGALYYLGAFFGLFATVGMFILGSGVVPLNQPGNNPDMPPEMMKYFFLGAGAFYLFATILAGFLGYGLRRLQVWSRWTVLVLMVLSLLYTLVVGLIMTIASPIVGLVSLALGSLIPGYILYLVASPKAGVVFSSDYKVVIAMTPHVKLKTSLWAKIALILFVLLILGVILAAFAGSRN